MSPKITGGTRSPRGDSDGLNSYENDGLRPRTIRGG